MLICFILSLVPWRDLENRIYSARLMLRPQAVPAIEIIEMPGGARRTLEVPGSGRPLLTVSLGPSGPGLITDSDGWVANAVAVTEKGVPSTAYQAYVARGLDRGRLHHPESPHLINFAGPPGTIPRCSLARGDCPNLDGKIALLVQATRHPERADAHSVR